MSGKRKKSATRVKHASDASPAVKVDLRAIVRSQIEEILPSDRLSGTGPTVLIVTTGSNTRLQNASTRIIRAVHYNTGGAMSVHETTQTLKYPGQAEGLDVRLLSFTREPLWLDIDYFPESVRSRFVDCATSMVTDDVLGSEERLRCGPLGEYFMVAWLQRGDRETLARAIVRSVRSSAKKRTALELEGLDHSTEDWGRHEISWKDKPFHVLVECHLFESSLEKTTRRNK